MQACSAPSWLTPVPDSSPISVNFPFPLVEEADGVTAAMPLLAERDYDVVITDQKMPDGDGLKVLAIAHEGDPSVAVVFLTAVPTIELAVESMRRGAFDFITKPFNPEVVRAIVRRACERTNLLRENQLLKTTVGNLLGADSIFGNSIEITAVREQIARVAPTDATVLIVGETGTGKNWLPGQFIAIAAGPTSL